MLNTEGARMAQVSYTHKSPQFDVCVDLLEATDVLKASMPDGATLWGMDGLDAHGEESLVLVVLGDKVIGGDFDGPADQKIPEFANPMPWNPESLDALAAVFHHLVDDRRDSRSEAAYERAAESYYSGGSAYPMNASEAYALLKSK